MKRFLSLGALLLSLTFQAAADPAARRVAPVDSRFGIDYVLPNMPRFQSEEWPKRLSRTGAGWVNFAEICWNKIEPRKPVRGVHEYRWQKLDHAVRLWQKYDFRIAFSLRMQAGWFSGPMRYRADFIKLPAVVWNNTDRLPRPEYSADYEAWIQAMVERYDGDGQQDMPGLRYAILHYQVGNEYANPIYWTGTFEDYKTLLKQTRRAARAACSQVQIISNGIRWNDLFCNDPEGRRFEEVFERFLTRLPSDSWRAGWKRVRAFTEGTVALAGDYDILDAGGNGPYPTASAGYMSWLRRELARSGHSTTIWDMEARSEPQIQLIPNTYFHSETAIPGGKNCLTAMKRLKAPDHDDAVARYRAEQARLLAQVFVSRFAAGFEKVFMGMPDDWDGTVGALVFPNPYLGLMDGEGQPWPAFFALTLLVDRLDGFARASLQPAPEGVEFYRFDFADGRQPVWVAWLREERARAVGSSIPKRKIHLPAVKGPVHVWIVPTRAAVARPTRDDGGESGLTLDLGPTPLILESR